MMPWNASYPPADLVHPAVEAAQRSDGTPVWLPVITVIAMITVAGVGWWLTHRYRHDDRRREDQHRRDDHRRDDTYRQQDHQRDDLADIRRLLEEADLQRRRLSRLDSVAGRADFTHLQELHVRVERAAERGPAALHVPFANVARCMEAYIDTAVPEVDEAMEIYCKASAPEEVPANWNLAVLLKQAERQGRAASALAEAIRGAEQAVEELRAS